MTRVQFYHNTSDPLALACELIARACSSGRKIALRMADADAARRADQMLWTFNPQAFVPHVLADSPLATETPVIVGHAGGHAAWPEHDLLFNLASDVPPGFDAFRMVIEIVGRDEEERLPARARWMQYKQQGHALQAFDSERREAIA